MSPGPNARKSSVAWPVAGCAAALLVSPLAAFGLGRPSLYALVLLPLTAAGWLLTRYPRRDLGLRIGAGKSYPAALAYPILTILLACAAVLAASGGRPNSFDLRHIAGETGMLFAYSFVLALLTEEGFFRGWLWAAWARSGVSPGSTLWFTSIAFALWHYAVTLLPGSRFTPSETALYLANILFIGLNFGMVRLVSGSIVTSALAHAVWNALAYILFGSPENAGVLNAVPAELYDPERGVIGLALNATAALVLWRLARPDRARA